MTSSDFAMLMGAVSTLVPVVVRLLDGKNSAVGKPLIKLLPDFIGFVKAVYEAFVPEVPPSEVKTLPPPPPVPGDLQ